MIVNCLGLTAVFLFSLFDVINRRIPNFLTISAACVGISVNFYLSGLLGIGYGCLGFAVGMASLLLPFILGGIGAGDVKAMAALGALIGPSAVFQTFLYTALIGGVIAVLYYLVACDIREKARSGLAAMGTFAVSRDSRYLVPVMPKKKPKFPYAPAMLLGYLAYLAFGNLV